MKKYGFFGGSFNPPTIAHERLAEEIADKLKHVADVITEMDCEMQDIRHMIEFIDDNTES